jgi:hypothetical protein
VSQQIFGRTWLWDELAAESRTLALDALRIGEEEAEFRHRVLREYYALLQARLGLELARTGCGRRRAAWNWPGANTARASSAKAIS